MPSAEAPVVAGVSHDQPYVLWHALREAARLRVPMRVVHCYAALAGDVYMGSDPHEVMRAAGVEVLDTARTTVESSGLQADVSYVLERGDPVTCLLEEARAGGVVVVGADDATWLERMLGGNVSGRLALGAPCPVVVVPPGPPGRTASGVVVTLGGDTSSAGPLRYGFEQAEVRGQDLHVLHSTPAATTPADVRALTARVRREVAHWNELTPDVRVLLSLTDGDALDECIAATARASLLVIGRPHGHAFSFALTRPVARTVLREARCPVAVVPADYGHAGAGSASVHAASLDRPDVQVDHDSALTPGPGPQPRP